MKSLQEKNYSKKDSKWRSLLIDNTNAHAICTLDNSGVIISWNKSAERLIGYKLSEVFGKNYSMLLEPKEIKNKLPQKALSHALLKGVFKFEKICVHKNHTFFWGSFSINPVLDEKGKFQFFVLIIQDITDRKEEEQRKDEYIGIASHELRTPVSALSLYSELLAGHLHLENDKKNLKIFQDMKGQINRLVNLIDDLLVINEIDRNKLILNKKPFLINKFIRKIIHDFQGLTMTHKIILKGKVTGKVLGDETRLTQVLTNLISNSIKYSPSSEKVVIGISEHKSKVIVSVQDFGSGITLYQQKSIFGKYFRSYSLEQGNMPGLGLGLYISKEIINKHNERIWIKSNKKKGSTFFFSLPRV